MSNRDLFNQKEFPVWEGEKFTERQKTLIKALYLNDINLLAKGLILTTLRASYYKDILKYIQTKMYFDEPLGLCLNSAKEILDIMITPLEILNDKDKEFTLDDYDDIEEWTVEREDKDDPASRQYMLCRTCDFATESTIDFDNHICNFYNEKLE